MINREMHILYIHQYFTTPALGGGTRSYEFAVRLARSGHEVTIITGSTLPRDTLRDLPEGITVLTSNTPYHNSFGGARRIRAYLEFALHATRIGWKITPDVIIATSTPLTVGIPALVLSNRHKVPFVFEVRDLWPEAPIQMGAIRNRLLIKVLRAFERKIYCRAAHVIALSPGMRAGVVAAGTPPEKVTMIPNASDLSLFEPGPIDDEFLRERMLPLKPTIAYAGTLGEANAMDVLAEVAVRLHELKVNVQILVAGDGRYFGYLDEIIRRRNLTTMTLLGRLSKPEVVQLYRASKAGLVLFSDIPILQTNSPNKFFDLLAAGRPVITNMRGWIADLVRNHRIGYVAEGRNVDGLVNAILSVTRLTEVEFADMAANARRLAEKEFDRDILAKKFEEVLRNAAQVN